MYVLLPWWFIGQCYLCICWGAKGIETKKVCQNIWISAVFFPVWQYTWNRTTLPTTVSPLIPHWHKPCLLHLCPYLEIVKHVVYINWYVCSPTCTYQAGISSKLPLRLIRGLWKHCALFVIRRLSIDTIQIHKSLQHLDIISTVNMAYEKLFSLLALSKMLNQYFVCVANAENKKWHTSA